jgi:hypothetical protein
LDNPKLSDRFLHMTAIGVSPVGLRPGEGPLTEPTAASQPLERLPLFMPHTCSSQCPSGSAQLGGQPMFAEACLNGEVAP